MSDCINGEIISVTVTVDEETVIGTINTAARGPQGEPGTGGGGAWNELTGTADSIPFTVTTAPAHSEGTVYYDSTDHSLTYYVDEADVSMNIGREMWIRVRNDTGSTIANGKVVYLSGATGQTPTIALARANALATSRVIGIATHDIENNSFGYVTTVGEVKGLNTSAYTDGAMLFLSASTAGELTTTAPTTPNRAIQVATVSHAHVSQGKLFCHPETDSVDSTGIADSTSIGRALVTASTASVGRTTLGSTATGDALFTAASVAAAKSTLGIVSKRKTTQTDRNNAGTGSTYTTDGDFTIPVTAGQTYRVEFAFYTTATSASGFKGQFTIPSVPSNITASANGIGITSQPGAAIVALAMTTGGLIGTAALTRGTATTNGTYHGFFEVTIGTTGGNLLFQWAQSSASVDNTSVLANSSVTAIERTP